MPRSISGIVILLVFLAAVWYAWKHYVKAKVQ